MRKPDSVSEYGCDRNSSLAFVSGGGTCPENFKHYPHRVTKRKTKEESKDEV